MEERRLFKLGIEKAKNFQKNFDAMYDKYKAKAESQGYEDDLVFIKEHGKVLIYAVLYL